MKPARKNAPASAKQIGFIFGLRKQATELGMWCRKIDIDSMTAFEASRHIRELKERIRIHKMVESK